LAGKIEEVDRNAIINDPDYSPSRKTTLVNMLDAQVAKLRGDVPTPGQRKRLASYGFMNRVTRELKDGEITYDAWLKHYSEHWLSLDEEDAETFMDRATGADPYKAWRTDAEKMAQDAMEGLDYDEEDYGEGILNIDESVGRVMKELDALVKDHERLQKPLYGTAYRDEARRIAREVYLDESKKLNEPEEPETEPTKPKRRRGGYYVGMTVKGKDGVTYEVVKLDANGQPLFRKK